MSAKKTAWHPPFTHMLEQRRPRWITVRGEVQLTTEPLRVDDLLEVWTEGPRDLTDTGGTLHAMWRHIERVGLLEFKSPVWPFHHGDLYRLLAYGARWLARHATRTLATARWVREHQGTGDDAMSTQATPDLFGYDEWIRQYLEALTPEQRLAGLAPEQRLAGLAPEQRLAGLTEFEQVLALPDHLLRMLPEAYIATLPEDVRATVRARRRA